MLINAEGHILGRLATEVVKQLKSGEDVQIINAERCVVSGRKEQIIAAYQQKKDRGQRYFGPFYPRLPDRIIKRTIRSMLPDTKQGGDMLQRLRVYVGEPAGVPTEDAVYIDNALKDRLSRDRYVTLGEIAQHIGAPPEVSA